MSANCPLPICGLDVMLLRLSTFLLALNAQHYFLFYFSMHNLYMCATILYNFVCFMSSILFVIFAF